MTNESKVGALFFAALGILLVMTVLLGGVRFRRTGYEFNVLFSDVMGLEKGAKVLVSGVDVGRVKDIRFEKSVVTVVCWIDSENVFIPCDSIITVEQASLLAGMQLSIMPGQSEVSIKNVPPIKGQFPVNFTKSLGQLSDEARRIIEEIKYNVGDTAASIKDISERISSGPGSIHDFLYKDTLSQNMEEAASKLRAIAEEVESGKGTVGKLVNDEKLYNDLVDITQEIKEVSANIKEITKSLKEGHGAAGKLLTEEDLYNTTKEAMEEIKETAANTKEITSQIKKGEGSIGKIYKDESFYQDLRGTILDARTTIVELDKRLRGEGFLASLLSESSSELYENIKSFVATIKRISEQIENREGTVSRLIFEDDVYEDIKEITKSIRSSAERVDEMLKNRNSTIGKLLTESDLYDNANKSLENLNNAIGPAARMRVNVSLGEFFSKPFEQNTTKIAMKLYPRESRYFLLGASLFYWGKDSSVSFNRDKQDRGYYVIKPDFQLAYLFDITNSETKEKYSDTVITLRAGLIEGAVGGGVDVDFLKNFRLTVEARNSHSDTNRFDEHMSKPIMRSFISMRLFKHFRLYAGVDNILDDYGFCAGIVLDWDDEDIKGIVGLISLGN
ncbi:MAG: MlaD family protein [Planctomycetota bacterium]